MDVGISTVIYSDFCRCARNPDLFAAFSKSSDDPDTTARRAKQVSDELIENYFS